jgi:hypothetical protein
LTTKELANRADGTFLFRCHSAQISAHDRQQIARHRRSAETRGERVLWDEYEITRRTRKRHFLHESKGGGRPDVKNFQRSIAAAIEHEKVLAGESRPTAGDDTGQLRELDVSRPQLERVTLRPGLRWRLIELVSGEIFDRRAETQREQIDIRHCAEADRERLLVITQLERRLCTERHVHGDRTRIVEDRFVDRLAELKNDRLTRSQRIACDRIGTDDLRAVHVVIVRGCQRVVRHRRNTAELDILDDGRRLGAALC